MGATFDNIHLCGTAGLGYKLDPRFNSLRSQSVYTTTSNIDIQYYSTSITAKPCQAPAAPLPKVSNRRLLALTVTDQADFGLIRLPVSYMGGVLTNETTAPGVMVSTRPLCIVVPYA